MRSRGFERFAEISGILAGIAGFLCAVWTEPGHQHETARSARQAQA